MSTFKDDKFSDVKRRKRSRKGAPGLLDVAQRAGVSGATVSRCYNHADSVQPATRKRILDAARELGYIRDRIAGTLHGRRSGTVGLVVPTIDNAIFSELIEAFTAQLQLHDHTMLIASHNYDLEREVSIIHSLLERRIDAVALVGRDHSDVALEMLRLRDIPTLALWNTSSDGAISSIGADNQMAAQIITQHVLDLGHTNIAMLFPNVDRNDRARDRKQGVLRTLQNPGISVPEHWDLNCPYSAAAGKAVALQLLSERHNAPTAIICANDVIAYGTLYAAHQLGLHVPNDVTVVGIGDFGNSSIIEPTLTTVRLPARRIGQLAATELVEQLQSPYTTAVKHTVIPAELIVRASSGRCH